MNKGSKIKTEKVGAAEAREPKFQLKFSFKFQMLTKFPRKFQSTFSSTET